ncbi:hypothetical protein [Rhodopseudomonas palustris]|uniref:hypothetical protein n=1 Tax=Rhodopseudomonas palustris TaxID=1076 RepID=UPI0014038807|nr:hypothetical protein [Rhodopseudomonas palustris]
MTYEQALAILGDAPAWELRSIIERAPDGSLEDGAARVLLRRKVAMCRRNQNAPTFVA